MEKKTHAGVSDEGSTTVALQEERTAPSNRLNFSNPAQREAHIQAFFAWLPTILRDAPGITWEHLSSKVMGYFIRTVADSPDAVAIALSIGSAIDAMKQRSLLNYCRHLTELLRQLRVQYGMNELGQLRTRDIWDRFTKDRMLSSGELRLIETYATLASVHVRTYLDGLTERQQIVLQPYMLPPLPRGFLDKQAQRKAVYTVTSQRRREQSDVLLPLFPLLVEIAQLHKQATARLTKEFRQHRDRAEASEIELPYQFQYTDRLFSVPEDASTLAEVRLIEREVTHTFTLWDRTTWVKAHHKYYSRSIHWHVKRQIHAYAPERILYFLQYEGKPQDLLWCGDLIAKQGLNSEPVSRPGLLTPARSDSLWLIHASHRALRSDETTMLFEPESLYRGTLYACALATLALTNGSRLNELLQVSATRFETLVVDELQNQQPTGRKIGILVQNLLPKGSRQESERQFFLIGEMAARLLAEIGQILEKTHGGSIPVVQPSGNTKEEDLYPEPYLFQWDASSDGRIGLLLSNDVGYLLRFLFHGLTLTTRTGMPIRVAPHLLRHVMATHARTIKKVPAEAVAYLLHHRVILPDSTRTLTISEATAYYSRLTLEQLLALLFEAQSTIISSRSRSYLQVPPPQTLEQMDAALRRIFEQWGTIGPTVLGYCSAGLCVRPENRALCLNCQYLVPHYSNLPRAKIWRKLYVLQAQMHDTHGHHIDAQQSRQMIGYLDDVIAVMEIQIRVRQDGGGLPFADTLPPFQGDAEGDVQ